MFFQASNTRHVPTILTKLQLPHMSILTRWHDWIHHLNAIRIGVLTLELEHKKYLQCLFKHLTPGVCQLFNFFKGFYLTNFTGNLSSTWKAFSYGLELLKKGLVWRVENGESIRIWRDSWLPRISNGKVLTQRILSYKLSVWIAWWSRKMVEQLIRDTFFLIDADAILKIKSWRQGHFFSFE